MSLVICVCSTDYSVMVGDSRMIAFNENKDIQVVDENIKKVLRINEDISIGYAGDPVPILTALQELDSYNREVLTLGQTKKILTNKIKTLSANELGAKIIISGKNKYGKMLMYVLDKKNSYNIIKYEPKPLIPAYACCTNDEQKIIPVLSKYINESIKWKTAAEITGHLRCCIEEASKIDISINNNIQEVVIK